MDLQSPIDSQDEHKPFWRTRRRDVRHLNVYHDFEEVLWAEEHETPADIEDAWGDLNTHSTVEEIGAMNTQLYAVQTLCEGEAFTIVRSAGQNCGFEAWRRLVRRYDPSTGERRRTMLRHILNPNKCAKLEELSSAIESWEEQVRQYESRRRSDGTRHQLDQEIKISVLEHLCTSELDRHLQQCSKS